MVDRRTTYLEGTSDQMYYMKMVSMRLGYAGLEDARKMASYMLTNWKNIFVSFYNELHKSHKITDSLKSLASAGVKGAGIRYINYYLEDWLLTGRVTYQPAVTKVNKAVPNPDVAKYLAVVTACASMDVGTISKYYLQVNPNLAKALSDNCPKLSYNFTTDMTDHASELSALENAFIAYGMVNVPRSYVYYYLTGLARQNNGIQGTQGGEVTSPSGATPVPVSPDRVRSLSNDGLTRAITNLSRYAGR